MSHDDMNRYRPPARRVTELRRSFYAGEIANHEWWYEQLLSRQWRAAYRLRLERPGTKDARFVIAEVRVFPNEQKRQKRQKRSRGSPGEWSGIFLGPQARVPRGGIPARVMNKIRSRATLETVRRVLNNVQEQRGKDGIAHGKGGLAQMLRVEESDLPVARMASRGRPPARTRSFYREFAERFRVAEESNRFTRASTRRVLARRYGVKEHTIGNWVRICRRMRLLPPTKMGRRGVDFDSSLSP